MANDTPPTVATGVALRALDNLNRHGSAWSIMQVESAEQYVILRGMHCCHGRPASFGKLVDFRK